MNYAKDKWEKIMVVDYGMKARRTKLTVRREPDGYT